MNGPSVEETEALFSERLGDLAPTLEKIDRADWVKVGLTVRPGLAARLIRARNAAAGAGAGDEDRGQAMAFLLKNLLDPILHELADDLNARYAAERATEKGEAGNGE